MLGALWVILVALPFLFRGVRVLPFCASFRLVVLRLFVVLLLGRRFV